MLTPCSWRRRSNSSTTAAKLRPTHAGVQAGCGRVLVKLGRKDEARARFEAALKLNSELESAKKALAELDATADK